MCFLKKHSHQNHKWTVSGEVRCCWTSEDPFGEEHSNPLPKCICHKKPKWNGSLMRTNILCNPQGGNDYKWGVAKLELHRERLGLRTEVSAPALWDTRERIWFKGPYWRNLTSGAWSAYKRNSARKWQSLWNSETVLSSQPLTLGRCFCLYIWELTNPSSF